MDDGPAGGTVPDEKSRVSVSTSGAGTIGFTGTADADPGASATGLTTLASDPFGGGPVQPLLPSTWHPDGETGHRQDDAEGGART